MSLNPTTAEAHSDGFDAAYAVYDDAISYAFVVRDRGEDGLIWLDEWRKGDATAMSELIEWSRSNQR